MQNKLKMNFDTKLSQYDDAKTTLAKGHKSHVFSKDTTPSKRTNNDSLYMNFKVFDSTVIGDQGDAVRLPKIKPQGSTKLTTMNSANFGSQNTTKPSRAENSKSLNLLKRTNGKYTGKLRYFPSDNSNNGVSSKRALPKKVNSISYL